MELQENDVVEIVSRVITNLRPQIAGVLGLGTATTGTPTCCEEKCPCNEKCGDKCGCNAKCKCEGKTASQLCSALEAVSGIDIGVIDPKEWSALYEHLKALDVVRTNVLRKSK